MPGPLILALDAAGARCSVCLWREGAALAELSEEMTRGQAERLVPMMQEVLSAGGANAGEIAAIAVTSGPGSFTGVRIGLAAAMGYGLAFGVPVVAIDSFSAAKASLSAEERDLRPLIVALAAKRREVFVEAWDAAEVCVLPRQLIAPDALAEAWTHPDGLLAGDGAEQLAPAFRAAGRDVTLARSGGSVSAAAVAALASGREWPEVGQFPSPIYLRDADTTKPKAKAF